MKERFTLKPETEKPSGGNKRGIILKTRFIVSVMLYPTKG